MAAYVLLHLALVPANASNLLTDFRVENRLRMKTDASVAKSLASRRGVGGVRHIEVNQLWLQEKVNLGLIEVEKVRGESNLADALTKHKDRCPFDRNPFGVDWSKG